MATITTPTSAREERFAKSFPQTPPYTPHSRFRFSTPDSPATPQSIHPLETISPSKAQEQEHAAAQDGVHVEELHEGDAGFTNNDTDLIYPEELEEPKSPGPSHASTSTSSSSTSSVASDQESDITQHLSRLACAETPLERRRRLQRKRKRTESRVFKRSHSQSVHGDAEMSDVDGMPDQDRNSSARRLRRRLRGPSGVQVVVDEVTRTPPPSRGYETASDSMFGAGSRNQNERQPVLGTNDDNMDVDEDSK